MTRILLVLAVLLAASAAFAAGQPLARIVVHGDQPVLAGQQVQVDVQIFAPNFFMSAPEFPLFDMPGAIVTMPDDRAVNLVETIDGQDYSGIQKSYVVTPLVGGELAFPSAEISFRYAIEPGKPADGSVVLPPQKLVVKVPDGAVGPNGPVPLARLSLTQSLDRDAKGLVAGDALVRSIDITAEGMPAMMIPPPALDAPAGVRVYRKDPRLSDNGAGGRGFKRGERLETVTYVFEKPGEFDLPAVTEDWFDASTGKIETARVEAIKVTVAPSSTGPAIAPDQPAGPAGPPPAAGRWKALAAAAALIVLALAAFALLRRSGPSVRGWMAERRRRIDESETAYFGRVREAFAAGDAMAIYLALDRWARRVGFASMTRAAATAGDARLTASLQRLESGIFGPVPATGAFQDADLLDGVAAMRKSMLHGKSAGSRQSALPPLNPPFAGGDAGAGLTAQGSATGASG